LASPAEITSKEKPLPAKTPEEVDALFAEGINAGDAAAVAALYEPNATLLMQPGGPATGPTAILEALKGLVALKPKIQMNIVNVISTGEVAVLYNDWTGSITAPDGEETAISGKAIEVVRKQPDGTWLFAVDDPRARDA
jgi:uncharacterized protein (TIGR02246 family)